MNADSLRSIQQTEIGSDTEIAWTVISSYLDSHKEELVRACKSFSIALRITDAGDSAEIGLEIFSEMVLQARSTSSHYDPTRPPSPWLKKIALRAAQRRAEREQKYRSKEISLEITAGKLFDLTPSPEDTEQERATIEALLAPLNAEARTLVLKVAVEGWDMKQVGAELGISASTVRQRYHRALGILRKSPSVQQWVYGHIKEQGK